MARSRLTMPISGKPCETAHAHNRLHGRSKARNSGVATPRRNRLIAHAETPHIVLRKIDAILVQSTRTSCQKFASCSAEQVASDSWNSSSSVIRTRTAPVGPPGLPSSGNIQAPPPCCVAGDSLVLAKRRQQIRERLFRNAAGANGFRQSDKHRMPRSTFVARVQFTAPKVRASASDWALSPTSSPRSSETRQ